MRESKFVEQNKEKWQELEAELKSNDLDPHFLRSKMIQITDDLSYSRTYYKNRSVRIYLNGLAQKIYNKIYKNRRNFFASLKTFYLEDIPKILYHARKELLIAFLLLLLSTFIGAFSTAKDPNFASSILTDGYVEMTKENIKKGDPFGVYKDSSSSSMFLGIALNNLKVSLLVFLFGLLASYGSLVMMIYNGIMLGTFIYFFYSRGLSTEFNLTVWMHGSIEMLTLVIETTAGMLLGRGLIYPGTLSRTKAFSIWGRRGAMLFLSAVPFILLAAFIESYLTRHTELPNLARAVFILLSVGMMIVYFVIFPLWKFRKSKDLELGMPEMTPEPQIDFKTGVIYNGGNLFLKTVQVISRNFSSFISIVLLSSLFYALTVLNIFGNKFVKTIQLESDKLPNFFRQFLSGETNTFKDLFGQLGIVFNKWNSPLIFSLSTLWLGVLIFVGLNMFRKTTGLSVLSRVSLLLYPFLISAFINVLYTLNIGTGFFYILLISPMAVMLTNKLFTSKDESKFTPYFSTGYGKYLGISGVMTLMFMICLIFLMTPLFYIIRMVLELNIDFSDEMFQQVMTTFSFFTVLTFSSVIIIFIVVQSAFLTFTFKEIHDANGLKESITQIGKSKKAYGIETE